MRKALSNKQRFEIFKRDGFKCQYCGGNPPEVKLQVDHIEPHSKGGKCEEGNFITACVACNSGKGANPIIDSGNNYQEAIKKLVDYFTCVSCGLKENPWESEWHFDKPLGQNLVMFQTDVKSIGDEWDYNYTISLCLNCINSEVSRVHEHKQKLLHAYEQALKDAGGSTRGISKCLMEGKDV